MTLQQVEGDLGHIAIQSVDGPRARIKNPEMRSNGMIGVDRPFRRTRRPRP